MPTAQILYTPHEGQRQFHRSTARFRVLCCGRRWGKDIASINEAWRLAVKMSGETRVLIPKVLVWFVAPTFPHLLQTWEEIKAIVPAEMILRKNEADKIIECVSGITLEFKSADHPDSLVGRGPDIIVMTEAARVKEDAWQNLRPSLSSPGRGPYGTGGLMIMNSSPRGRNWFYKVWLKGQKTIGGRPNPDYDQNWASWRFPSGTSPHMDPEELRAGRRDLPLNFYEQEYEANFLGEAAGVFVFVQEQAKGRFASYQPGRKYAAGVDLAFKRDFTVVTIADVTNPLDRHIVYQDRFHDQLWHVQEPRIVEALKKYHSPPTYVDETGVGQHAPGELRKAMGYGAVVEGYYFSPDKKEAAVQELQMAFQTRSLDYPPELDNFRLECEQYEYSYTEKTKKFTYSAPKGEMYHDDTVMSAALALLAARLKTHEVRQGAYHW